MILLKSEGVKKWGIGAVITLVAAIVLIYAFSLYLEYSQVKEIGEKFTQVFFTDLKAKLISQIVSFLLVFVLSYLSINTVKMSLLKIDSTYSFLKRKYILVTASFLLALFISNIVKATVYERMLGFLNPVFFGKGDPLFFKDIGYYLFQRPFLVALFDSLLYISVFLTVTVFLMYLFLCARLGISAVKELMKSKGIVAHNLTNIAFVIIMKTIGYILKAEEILYTENASFFGAGYTENTVLRTYYGIMPWILVAAVVLTLVFMKKQKIRYAVLTVLVYPLSYVVLLASVLFVQTFAVKPQEATMEAPYIANNIKYTQMAYGIDGVEKKEFPLDYNLDGSKVAEDSEALSNIRIIDYASSKKAINQLQGIRNYYDFNDIDIVKYNVDGKESAVAMAARELNLSELPENSKSFLNKRLKFTHGYGLVALRVNKVTEEGQPSFLIKDIPPVCEEDFVTVRQPRIYFGETTDEYSVVNTSYKELDYSSGDTDVEFSYGGNAGISMNFINRIIYSAYYGDFQLLISGLIGSESKLLINRNVVERVSVAAPFLSVSSDPYILIDENGRIKWIVDCFTTSSYYPYAQPVRFKGENVNYIRNSVKAVVDAYDGDVKFYITDTTDPIAQSYKRTYPEFFEKTSVTSDLSSHMIYSEELFSVQAEIFKRYHISDVGVFYNNTDNWDIAREKYQTETKYLDPYYTFMKTENGAEKMILMLPYTMTGKDNLVAWLGVDNDLGSNKMMLYTFPKGENVYGTMQIENRIDNDPHISKELTLWNQGGSNVIRGNMLVIPVGKSVIYVEPIYISSSDASSIPELKRVIVASGEKIVMETNLHEALKKLFEYDILSEKVQTEDVFEPIVPENTEDMSMVVELFDSMKNSLKEGDWEGFGVDFTELEREIEKIRQSLKPVGETVTETEE